MPMNLGRTLGASLFLAGLAPAVAAAQSTPILAIVPQGAVIDAAPFPDLTAGATFSLRSSQGDGTELARGSVVDVRDGRALVGVRAGVVVKAGDVALRCATAASQEQLRASLEQIKAQMTSGAALCTRSRTSSMISSDECCRRLRGFRRTRMSPLFCGVANSPSSEPVRRE